MMGLALDIHMDEFLMVLGMAAVTYGIRYVMFPLSGRMNVPPLFEKGLKFVPPTVLTAIITPSVFLRDGVNLNLSLDNPYLIGVSIACVMGAIFKNLLLTIVVSMAVFLLAQYCFAIY